MQIPSPFITITNLNHLDETAKELLVYAASYKIWLFTGELGAGKTTLIKAICKELGIIEHVTSPTFSLINTYSLASRNPVYHLDAYRLNCSEADIIEMDYPFYFETGSYCFIEWPDKILNLIPPPYINIEIMPHHTENNRRLCVKRVEA